MRVMISVPINTGPYGTGSGPQVVSPGGVSEAFSLGPPIIQAIQWKKPRLSQVTVYIPKGHAYLTGLQMRAGHAGEVLVPERGSNTDWLIGDDQTVVTTMEVRYDFPSFEIQFRAYNSDDTWPHTFYIDLEG